MHQPEPIKSRKKFLIWSAAILSSLTILKLIPGKKGKKNTSTNETVKMLSQDGKLVEIDKRLLASSAAKISNEELQQWIKNKSTNK
ncbi:MAG: hypothetical protein ACHQFX_20625 [Chitinophagales bacterium]